MGCVSREVRRDPLVITDFLEGSTCVDELLAYLTEKVWDELKEAYPEIHGRDDVLSLLVHLGYLGYDAGRGEAFIPNREILEAFRTSTNGSESEPGFVHSHSGK